MYWSVLALAGYSMHMTPSVFSSADAARASCALSMRRSVCATNAKNVSQADNNRDRRFVYDGVHECKWVLDARKYVNIMHK